MGNFRMIFHNEYNTRLLTITVTLLMSCEDRWPLIYSLIMSNPVISLNKVIQTKCYEAIQNQKPLLYEFDHDSHESIYLTINALCPRACLSPVVLSSFCFDQELHLICGSVSLLFIHLGIWHHTWRLSSSLKAQASLWPHHQRWSPRMGPPCTVLQPPTSLMISNGG